MSQTYIGVNAGLVHRRVRRSRHPHLAERTGLAASRVSSPGRLCSSPSRRAGGAARSSRLAFELSETVRHDRASCARRRVCRTPAARCAVGRARSVAPERSFVDRPGEDHHDSRAARGRLHRQAASAKRSCARHLETSPLTRWEKGDKAVGVVTRLDLLCLRQARCCPRQHAETRRHLSAAGPDRSALLPPRWSACWWSRSSSRCIEKELRSLGIAVEGKAYVPALRRAVAGSWCAPGSRRPA